MRSPNPCHLTRVVTALAAVALAGSLAAAPTTARADEVLDQIAPTITLDPITPGTIYTGEAAQKVTVRAHVTENSGQMDGVAVYLTNYARGGHQLFTLLKLVEGTQADGIWEGTVELPRHSPTLLWHAMAIATDATTNARESETQTVMVRWYERYQPKVTWQDNCGSTNDHVITTPHDNQVWSVTPYLEQLDQNTYRVESGTTILVNAFVPNGSSEIISQDGSVDDFAASFSHTFSATPCTLATSTPTITGTAQVGKTLTATPGTWTAGTTLAHQWLRNGVAIPGATGTTHTLTAADKGARISVRVTGTKAEHTTASRTSAATTPVAAGRLAPRTPAIRYAKGTMTAVPGAWTGKPTLHYQWLRNGKAITGATRASYRPTAADRNRPLTVRVTATKPGYTTTSATSLRHLGSTVTRNRACGTAFTGVKAFTSTGQQLTCTVTKTDKHLLWR